MPEKLFLIDGSALYYRSYFAFIRNPLINSKGENTSATFGFLASLLRLIEDENPDYICVVFDTKEPTFRHELYKEYKATREKMPEEMANQYPRLVDTLQRFNFLMLHKVGYEADDIIGTLAEQYASDMLHVYIVSSDKDMAQLVNDYVFLYTPSKGGQPPAVLNADAVKEKLGILPGQVIDWLTLMGDSSDNIPGVPKVGKKTAAKLLEEFGSMDQLYAGIEGLKEGAVKQNLIHFKDQTTLAKQLTTIKTDVPLKISLSELQFKMWDMQEAEKVLKELEFRQLYNRIQSISRSGGKVEDFEKHETQDAHYHLIKTIDDFERTLSELEKQEAFVFDLETSSLDFLVAEIAGIAFSWKEKQAVYIPLNHPDISLDSTVILENLRPLFENENIRKIAQNIKYDAMILKQHGLGVRGFYFDTLIASYLINPVGQHKLDKLSEQYLNYEMIHIEELIGSGKKQKLMTEIPAEEVMKYAAEDADITFRLYKIMKPELSKSGMENLFYNLEMPLIEVLMDMEAHGVALDTDLLYRLSIDLTAKITNLEKRIFESSGQTFNLNSPQQLGQVLFTELEIHKELDMNKPPKTKTGQISTPEKILERYAAHSIIENILDFRKLTKLKNTYLDALPQLISAKTGKIHTSFNQAVAATGRLSSSNPNLQNIPIRTEIGREIRKAFIASDNNRLILSADYSQIELRIMAHLSGDENMINSFTNRQDIHAATAGLIFDIPISEVTADHRRKAKEINFGIIYGMSRFGLASRLHIDVDEAEAFIRDYMATYPGIELYMRKVVREARETGYVETMMQRRRYLPEIKSANRQIREFAERTAINSPIQGSAADLIKKAMINIQRYILKENLPAWMILQVHDELVFEVEKSIVEEFAEVVKELMENAMPLQVPVIVDSGRGATWLEAHE